MGDDRKELFQLDQDIFKNSRLRLLKPFKKINQFSCFNLIHEAFDASYREPPDERCATSSNIFYHIHNPDPDELLGFIKAFPNHQIVYIVRHPLQGLESWMLDEIKTPFDQGQWSRMVMKFSFMIWELCSPFNKANAVGIRLEDVKTNPDATMRKLAVFMGIEDHETLYRSEYCGYKYWGPSSQQTGPITGFDQSSINKPIGRLFNTQDIILFSILFWPFSKTFSYTDMSEDDFKTQLCSIRPLLDEPLGFELKLYDKLENKEFLLKDMPPYKALHQKMLHAWEILNTNGTYPGMMSPLI